MNSQKTLLYIFSVVTVAVFNLGFKGLNEALSRKFHNKEKMFFSMNSPCKTHSGSVKVTADNPAITSYSNAVKNLDKAERQIAEGNSGMALNNLKSIPRYLTYVLKKEPNADISEICSRYKSLTEKAGGSSQAKSDFTTLDYELGFFMDNYQAYSTGYFENPRFKQQKDAYVNMPMFDRAGIMDKIKAQEQRGALGRKGQTLKQKLTNLPMTLKQKNIVNDLYRLLDELNNSAAVDLGERSKRVMQIIEGFVAIGGDNEELAQVLAFAQKQLKKADDEMASIYTGSYHKEHVNEVVFTKKPFTPGNESAMEMNPVFETGDAVYATLYLSASLKDALNCATAPNCTAGLKVEDQQMQRLDKWFEGWETNYKTSVVRIYSGTDTSKSYFQFLLVPNATCDLKKDIAARNMTVPHMARGMSKQSKRMKTFNVQVTMNERKTGSKLLKGSFKIDLSKGNAPEYYTKADNRAFEGLIKNNQLPTKKTSDAVLETKLLGIMNAQGYAEKYTKCLIQNGWQVYTPLGQTPYREMTAAFPYRADDGKCGFQIYAFRSLKSGSGWATPQKWGGTLDRDRVTCDKVD